MKSTIRILRIHLRRGAVRRGVTRAYHDHRGEFRIITTHFTEAEYDALHFVAAAMRVSVSWLVYTLIKLWRKEIRRGKATEYIANYELNLCAWQPHGAACSESLLLFPKPAYDLHSTSSMQVPILI